jgi:cobaltochelatase CobN
MAGRLLEAIERGLWEQPSPAMLTALRGAYLAAEGAVEGRVEV